MFAFGVLPVNPHPYNENPMVRALNIVPTMAIKRMVPMLLKKSLFGMQYPASRTMGGSMNRKNTVGVKLVSGI
jgi:hypothetical protein